MSNCIFASDLAIITGDNRFKSIVEIIRKIWERNYPDDYQNTLKKLCDRNLDLRIDETDMECIERISKKNNLSLDMTNCLNSNNLDKLSINKQNLLAKCENLDKEQNNKIKESINNLSNTNFGTQHESYAINKYCNMLDVRVIQINRFFKKDLGSYKDTNWIIGGKIDGLRKDNIIVEVKNRINKLFFKLRDYEKVQIYAYLYILDYKEAHLVEFLNKNEDHKINILEILFDLNYWKNHILVKIYKFIKFFHKFLETESLKVMLLTNEVHKLNDLANKFII